MTDRNADLKALFAEPASLPDSGALLRAILARIDRQQRRRSLLLAVAAFAGALPATLLVAALWPAIASTVDALTAAMNSAFGRDFTLSVPQLSTAHAQYGVWVMAALGLAATAAAAWRAMPSR